MNTGIKLFISLAIASATTISVNAQRVDFSVVSVPEETGQEFTRMTTDADKVCLPEVKRRGRSIDWFSNRVLAMVPGTDEIAYLSARNNTTNIFIKDMKKQGSSRQRTNRSAVIDFSFSPDGKDLYFSERRGKTNQIFRTSGSNGYICRQITSGANDYSPVLTNDGKQVFFTRMENNGSSIWSYNLGNNFLSSYAYGQNPIPAGNNALIMVRRTPEGRSELWQFDYESGVEECIISDSERSFSSPVISPDGKWILFVGSSLIQAPGVNYPNTDLFISHLDGTNMRQLTYHAADDLSPIWSNDGKYIYFVSQRGDALGTANIWRLTFAE